MKRAITLPEHGDGFRDSEWQVVVVYSKTRAFSDSEELLEVVPSATKRPHQSANDIRHIWAKMLGERTADLIVVARDF
jgi:hypothetical protein